MRSERYFSPPSPFDHALAREYVEIALGLAKLYDSRQGKWGESSLDKEGLIPVDFSGAHGRHYLTWDEAEADLMSLQRRYLAVENDIRRNYMQQQIGSLLALCRWCSGKALTFREKVRDFLYVNDNPFALGEMEAWHQKLDNALRSRGYKGSLAEKVAAWEESNRVPEKEVENVLQQLLLEARDHVAERLFPEVSELEMKPVIVHSVPYSGYCDYPGRKMIINGDLPYTYAGLKHLVCHEAFPGHATHMFIREQGIHSGEMTLDAGLVITNTASSSVFEGIGDNGMSFIEWENSPDDEIYALYQQIRSISGMNAAHMLHAEDKTDSEVEDFLEEFAFGHPNWIASRLRFFKHHLRAPFIYSYFRGYESVKEAFVKVAKEDRDVFYHFLYKNMLSADTVRQF